MIALDLLLVMSHSVSKHISVQSSEESNWPDLAFVRSSIFYIIVHLCIVYLLIVFLSGIPRPLFFWHPISILPHLAQTCGPLSISPDKSQEKTVTLLQVCLLCVPSFWIPWWAWASSHWGFFPHPQAPIPFWTHLHPSPNTSPTLVDFCSFKGGARTQPG